MPELDRAPDSSLRHASSGKERPAHEGSEHKGSGLTRDPRFAILHDVADPITVQDERGALVFANQAAAELCGFASAEAMVAAEPAAWVGRYELFDDAGRPIGMDDLPGRRLLAGLDAPDILLRFTHPPSTGRQERWAWVSARRVQASVQGSEPALVLNTFRDATKVVSHERAIEEELRLSRALQNVALAISSELDREVLVQRITDEATAICSAQFGAFFHNVEREEGGSYLLYTLSGAPREAFERFGQPRATPVFAPTFAGAGPVRSDDIRKDARYGRMGPHHGMPKGHLPVVSYLAIPVVSASGEVLGGLFFGDPEPARFTDTHERAVSAIAAHAAIALDNARLFQRARTNEARLSAKRTRLSELLQQAPAAIAVLSGRDHVYELTNPKYLALVGRKEGLVGKPIRECFPEADGQGVFEACDRVFQTGEPFVAHEMAVTFDRGKGHPEEGWFNFTITAVREGSETTGVMSVAIEVTEQVRARREIEALANARARSEQRFRSLVEATSQMVWSTTAEGEVQEDSTSWRDFTGQTYEEWKGFGWLDAVHPDDRPGAERAWRAAVGSKSKYEVDYRVRRRDGSYANTIARGTPILGPNGDIEEWIGLNFDITDRVEAENALRENERRLRLALEAGRMGTWEYDLQGNRVHWSPAIEQMHGIPVGSFDGSFEAYQRDIHPEDRAWVLEAIERNVREGREHKLLYRIVRPDGQVRWLEAFGTFVRDSSGTAKRLMGVCCDVTDRVETEAAQTALRIQRMLEGIADSFGVYDPEWTVVFANEACVAPIGLKPVDVVGKNLLTLVPAILGTKFHTELESVMRTGQPATFEEYFAPVDRWYEVHAYPIPEIGVAAYSRDVTERRSAQAFQDRVARYGTLRADIGAALAKEQALRSMLQACCDAIVSHLRMSFARVWLVDESGEQLVLQASAGKYTHVDGAHARVRIGDFKIGKIAAERRAHLTNDVLHDPRVGDRAWAEREGMVAFAGYPLIVGERLVGVMAAFATETLPEDTLNALAGIGDSIAQGVERRRAEIELAEHARDLARSNADLEQFAYVASHDLQEPLRMVASYVQLLERRYREKLDDDARDFIAFAVEGVTRMRRLIDDLLMYSRVGTRGREPTVVDLGKVVAAVEKNLEQSVAETGAVIIKDPLPQVLADEGQLVQLFQNLVSNAVKFRRDEEPARIHIGARHEGSEWVLSVRDNGIGIDPQYFERIFVIFQRLNARERYPGTGIGLAIAKKIVDRHGGRIGVDSTLGQGSTIHFTLPNAPRARRLTS